MTEVKFEVDKIKTAIDIVEQFKIKLDEINIGNDNNYSIEHDILEEINKEFNNYIQQKHSLLKLMRDCNDKMCLSVNELKMPCIEKFLSNNFATASSQGDKVCKYCEKYIPKSMSSHHRYCASKKVFDELVSAPIMIPDIVIADIVISNEIKTPSNVKKSKKKV